MIKVPKFAESFLGAPLLEKITQLIGIGQEFDQLLAGQPTESIIRYFRASGDIQALHALVCESGNELVARVRTRSQHRKNDRLLYGTNAITQIFEVIDKDQGNVGKSICQAMHGYTGVLLFSKEIEDSLKAGRRLKTKSDDIITTLIQQIMSYGEVLAALGKKMQSALGKQKPDDELIGSHFFNEWLDLTTDFQLPPIILHKLMAKTKASEYQMIMQSLKGGVGDLHIFGHAPCGVHIVHPVDMVPPETLEEITRIEKEPDSEICTYSFFQSEHSTSIAFSYSGLVMLNEAGYFLPVRCLLTEFPEQIAFLDQLVLNIMLEVHDIYDHLFKQIAQGEISGDDKQTVIHTPWTTSQKNQDIVLPVGKTELKDLVKARINFPTMKSREIQRSLRQFGCKVIRQTGSHVMFQAPNGTVRPLPNHGTKVIGIGLVTEMLRAFGLDRRDFLDHI